MGSKIGFSLKILFMVASLCGVLYAMKVLKEGGGKTIEESPMGALVAPPVEPATEVSVGQ